MYWLKRGFVYLLALIMLVSLIATAVSAGVRLTFAQPSKLEAWLSDSGVYNHVVDAAIQQSQQNSGVSQVGNVSFDDPAVKQVAESVFSPHLLGQYTDTFLRANYLWLQGKAGQPSFQIDLAGAKQQFADKLGDYTQSFLSKLPACSAAQDARLAAAGTSTDPLTLTCLPTGIDPQTEATQVSQQISQSNNFLTTATLTARSLNPNGSSSGQPYYQRLSQLPKVYKASLWLPFVFGAIALLSGLAVIWLDLTKRRGLRRVSIVLIVVGIILVAVKLIIDSLFKQFEQQAFKGSGVAALRQSLIGFIHTIESHLLNVDLGFAVGFVLLAVLILGIMHRPHRAKSPKPSEPSQPEQKDDNPLPRRAAPPTPQPAPQPTPNTDSPEVNPPSAPVFKRPRPTQRPPRPPRLIQ